MLGNNAGVMPVSPFDELRVEGREEMIDVNSLAPESVASAIAYAIEQPPEVDVSELVVRRAG